MAINVLRPGFVFRFAKVQLRSNVYLMRSIWKEKLVLRKSACQTAELVRVNSAVGGEAVKAEDFETGGHRLEE